MEGTTTHPSLFIYPVIHPAIHLAIHLTIHLAIHLAVHLAIRPPDHPSTYLPENSMRALLLGHSVVSAGLLRRWVAMVGRRWGPTKAVEECGVFSNGAGEVPQYLRADSKDRVRECVRACVRA